MTLPASGAITMSQVNSELGFSATAPISLNDAPVRALAGIPSGAISMSNLHGKSSVVAPTITRGSASGNYNYSGGRYFFYHYNTLRVNFTLGGTAPTMSWAVTAGPTPTVVLTSSYVTLTYNNTSGSSGTVRITATNSAGSAILDIPWSVPRPL